MASVARGPKGRGGTGGVDNGPCPDAAASLAPDRFRSWRTMLYDSYVSDIAVSEAWDNLAAAIELACTGEPVYVTRGGRRVAVIAVVEHHDALWSGRRRSPTGRS